MIRYIFSTPNPSNHFLEIVFFVETNAAEEIILQLPAWRPGRYELGNFAKNIQKFTVTDEAGKPLNFQKTSKDTWRIFVKQAKQITVNYTYYAAELNAGSTFLDENQLYVNPVNCCLFIPDRINEYCEIELNIPKNYKIACGLNRVSDFVLKADNFHELADSPFIASESLLHHSFSESGVLFNIWINGICKPQWEKLEKHFKAFASSQIKSFGKFPVSEYHFLFHILPYKAYHGVEHYNSTVITLGPSYDVMNEDGLYNELLGVSSHELYHTWNVKQIRPSEMWPYNYTKENYSSMGYLYEGATTYYGDVFLLRSKCFSENEYFKTFNNLLEKHFSNFGRFNLSVAASSFDTWLDGYVKGIPERKTSIYTEGALITFMLDILIRRNTKNKNSFDDVMRFFYTEFACNKLPVTEEIYKKTVEKFAEQDLTDFFNDYIYGTKNYEPVLAICFDYLGWEFIKQPSEFFAEAYLGIKTTELNGSTQVTAVYPNSLADISGIAVNDFILSVNNCKLAADFNKWCSFFKNDELNFIIKKEPGILKNIQLFVSEKVYYQSYSARLMSKISNEQIKNYEMWIG
jgi:predicted metalloprotease with PDZ domain